MLHTTISISDGDPVEVKGQSRSIGMHRQYGKKGIILITTQGIVLQLLPAFDVDIKESRNTPHQIKQVDGETR